MNTPDPHALSYARDGYVVLPGFKAAAELAALRRRAEAIVADFDPGAGSGIFSSTAPGRMSEAWLLDSAAGVRCFFEEEAFDAAGRLVAPKAKAVNKIGHALHDLDPVFEHFSRDAKLAALAAALGLHEPRLVQSMFIFKQPGIGGEVRWHQDATYLLAQDPLGGADSPDAVCGFWIALEDATRDNGCLWVQPGGHHGPLRERYERVAVGADTHAEDGKGPEGTNSGADDAAGAQALRLRRLDTTPWPTLDDAVSLEVAAGTLVVLHGRLPHWSAPNRSPHSRHAYTFHVVDGRAKWESANWIRRPPALPLRGF